MVAFERAFPRVRSLVLGLRILAAKFLVAKLASVRLFARMNSYVVDEMVLLPEACSTRLALEGSLGEVRLVVLRLLMIGKALAMCESFATSCALERLFSRVNAAMNLEVRFLAERLAAIRALPFLLCGVGP